MGITIERHSQGRRGPLHWARDLMVRWKEGQNSCARPFGRAEHGVCADGVVDPCGRKNLQSR